MQLGGPGLPMTVYGETAVLYIGLRLVLYVMNGIFSSTAVFV